MAKQDIAVLKSTNGDITCFTISVQNDTWYRSLHCSIVINSSGNGVWLGEASDISFLILNVRLYFGNLFEDYAFCNENRLNKIDFGRKFIPKSTDSEDDILLELHRRKDLVTNYVWGH